jgi:acetone carboxylase gamma subunit
MLRLRISCGTANVETKRSHAFAAWFGVYTLTPLLEAVVPWAKVTVKLAWREYRKHRCPGCKGYHSEMTAVYNVVCDERTATELLALGLEVLERGSERGDDL